MLLHSKINKAGIETETTEEIVTNSWGELGFWKSIYACKRVLQGNINTQKSQNNSSQLGSMKFNHGPRIKKKEGYTTKRMVKPILGKHNSIVQLNNPQSLVQCHHSQRLQVMLVDCNISCFISNTRLSKGLSCISQEKTIYKELHTIIEKCPLLQRYRDLQNKMCTKATDSVWILLSFFFLSFFNELTNTYFQRMYNPYQHNETLDQGGK